MHLAVVGCSIFKNEIDFLKPRITSSLEFFWLPQKLHNKPLELRQLIQDEIDNIDASHEPFDGIVLLYGLCSKGIMGISSGMYKIVVPKSQDCIGILLGSHMRYVRHFREKPGTYWFTKGWIETGFDPGKRSDIRGVFDPYRERYRQYRKKFNEEISSYLIHEWDQRWIKNYSTLAFIDWGMKESDDLRNRAQKSAQSLGLEFENIEGDPRFILDLLNGNWDSDRFLEVEPGNKILPSYSDSVLTCSSVGLKETDKALKSGEKKQQDRGKRTGIGLGIDAGGTYTDTVLYDFTREEVIASSKAPTTHENYIVGIQNSLKELFKEVQGSLVRRIGLVSLSTTLATNAIVEGKGGRVGLILIGYDQHSSRKIELGPKSVIRGKHSINGEVIQPIDMNEAEEAVDNLLADGVEAFAVSSEVAVRNPEFEIAVKELIQKKTDLPVVCGSELTAELNCVKRANTCYFNARLIPLVSSLLSSVKDVLAENEINAPIMVVKGDGTLMGQKVAQKNPIEMVLSGPAASVIGGAYLSNIRDGYVVDMGGTTTDVAYIRDGFVSFKRDGIHINRFKTAVKTVNVHTFGLGGDSYIRLGIRGGKISIGPDRVLPISYLACQYPGVVSELKRKTVPRGEETLVQPADFFVLQKDFKGVNLHPQEQKIIDVLKANGPMSRTALAQKIKAVSVSLIRTERLEMFGNIIRSALTPTDILHTMQALSFWNVEAAQKAVSLYAQRAGIEEKDFIESVLRQFYKNLLFHLFEFWFTEDGRIQQAKAFSDNLTSHLFFSEKEIQLNAEVSKPIVFIGAPAKVYGHGIEGIIGAEVVVPEFHGVANAVGAITGAIREDIMILIRPHVDGGFVAYTDKEKKYFNNLEEAKEEMVRLARVTVEQKAKMSGALYLNVDIDVKDKEVRVSDDDIIYLETVVAASITSIPSIKDQRA